MHSLMTILFLFLILDFFIRALVFFGFYPKVKIMGFFTSVIYTLKFHIKISDKDIYVKQLLISVIFLLFIVGFNVFILNNYSPSIIWLLPLMVNPLFFIIIALLSSDGLNVYYAVKRFRMHSIVNSMQIISIGAINWLWPQVLYVKIMFLSFSILALLFFYYLVVIECLPKKELPIGLSGDFSTGFSKIFFLVTIKLEIIYYILLNFFSFFNYRSMLFLNSVAFCLIIFLFLLTFLSLKKYFTISYNFLEKKALVSQIFLFGFSSFFWLFYSIN